MLFGAIAVLIVIYCLGMAAVLLYLIHDKPWRYQGHNPKDYHDFSFIWYKDIPDIALNVVLWWVILYKIVKQAL